MIKQIGDWITAVTGIQTVFREPYEGQRPKSGEYVTFQVISVTTPDQSYGTREANGTDLIDQTIHSHARVTVSINIYSEQGMGHLIRLKHSASIWSLRETLGDLVLIQLNQPRNLTALSTESFRARFQSDAVFHVDLTSTFTIDRLKQLIASGQWSAADDSDIITQDIDINLTEVV